MDPQRKADMSIMQVIRGADADITDMAVLRPAAQFFDMAVKALELGEKSGLREVPVQNAYAVMPVKRHGQGIARLFDGLHMAWRHESCCSNQGEIMHYGLPQAVCCL
jgi:hypothetical protein